MHSVSSRSCAAPEAALLPQLPAAGLPAVLCAHSLRLLAPHCCPALQYTGRILVPSAGAYGWLAPGAPTPSWTFRLLTDDFAKLRIDGNEVVHSPHYGVWYPGTPVPLSPGLHTVEFVFEQAGGPGYMYAYWTGPGWGWVPIAPEWLFMPAD